MADKTPEEIALERIREAGSIGARKLDLKGLGLTSLPPEIWNLADLVELDLAKNNLKEISSEVGRLSNLEVLNLGYWGSTGNSIKTLPDEIYSLEKLVHLFLVGNQITEISPDISKLSNLTILNLGENPVTKIPKQIGKLIDLRELHLADTPLASLPGEIDKLERLETLWLRETLISEVPLTPNKHRRLLNLGFGRNPNLSLSFEYISEFSNLQSFHAYSMNIGEFPKPLCRLKNLFELGLADNNIADIPPEIIQLSLLYVLDLSYNKITTLPFALNGLRNLSSLDLRGNPLSMPPEILAKKDEPSAILAAYFGGNYIDLEDKLIGSIEKEQKELVKRMPLYESKVVIVGQPSVGKSSIIQKMLFGTFTLNQAKTEGISISRWQVQKTSNKEISSQIRLNIWDFGGQEIMHATHQFFLTKRSLYLLVLDSRLTQEENRVEYWLKIIQSFGGESPILIVGNKIDQHPLDIDRRGLQKKYPAIVGILETSAATGAGIEILKSAIANQINHLPHILDLLPETWFIVKTKLERLGHKTNFITYDKYIEICDKNDISDEVSQHTLIGFLHDLGIVLHFQDDPRLEALGILNPQWVTNGVYKIINSNTLFKDRGVLTISMLNQILNLSEYPRGKRLFIVDIMKKFELCYDIEFDRKFLIPDLLPKDEPAELKFTGIPAFEYLYPVLPFSVLTRLIVRMNQHIFENCMWRTGVLLRIGGNTALVKADIEDRKITIAIDGLEHTRRDALSAIRYQLDEIHSSIKGLNAQKRVPIPMAPDAEPLDYEYLLQLERDGFEELPVKDGNRLVKINVRELLSGIESEPQGHETGGNVTNIYVGGNFDGNLTVGDGNQSIKDSYNKITSAKIDPELKQTLKLLTEAVSAMTKAIPDEQAAEVTEDLGKLVDEATKPKPNKKWYSVSIEGLVKAAENVEKVGEPVINLSRKVLSLLAGGMGK